MKSPLGAAFLTLALVAACAPKPPAHRKPAPDYQFSEPRATPPANLKKICYDPQAMSAYHVRMVQQEMAVGTLSCKSADGSRIYDKQYGATLAKFGGDLSANAAEVRALVAKRRMNIDKLVTEFANREAQRRHNDPQYCARLERAFAWALAPEVTSLAQVPPPHDLAPEMNAFPCPTP